MLVRFFEALRGGPAATRAQLPCGLSIDVPPELWPAINVVVDVVTGAVTSKRSPLFDHIDVAPQARPAPEELEFTAIAA